jgi:hypothetical protein
MKVSVCLRPTGAATTHRSTGTTEQFATPSRVELTALLDYSSQSTDLRVVLFPSPLVVVIYFILHSTLISRSALLNCAARRSTIVL